MEIEEIIKAYEIFRSHGLDVASLFPKKSTQNSVGTREIEKVSNPIEGEYKSLRGNTGKQWNFLKQLAAGSQSQENGQSYYSKDVSDLQQVASRKVVKFNTTEEHENIDRRVWRQIDRDYSADVELQEAATVSTLDRVQRDREAPVQKINEETEHDMETQHDTILDNDDQEKEDLENYTLKDLLGLKEEINEIYGEGHFDRYIEQEIVKFLGIGSVQIEENFDKPKSPIQTANERDGKDSGRSFKQALMGSARKLEKATFSAADHGRNLKPLSQPRREGDNIAVQLDVEAYRSGIQELQFSVLGRLTLQRGEPVPTNMMLKSKLETVWGIKNFKVIAMASGIFHILLTTVDDQCKVMAMGPINLKPGILRVSRWLPGFDSTNFRITMSQVWIRLHTLPLEFRKEQNIINLAAGVGMPLKIDPLTLSFYHGMYARVLVDVDFTKPMPERILAKMWDAENNLDVSFFVPISYEKLPKFCLNCMVFSHVIEDCRNIQRGSIERQENRQGKGLNDGAHKHYSLHLGVETVNLRNLKQSGRVNIQQCKEYTETVASKHNQEDARENNVSDTMDLNKTGYTSSDFSKPWKRNKAMNRQEKLDWMAEEIMAKEVLKIIEEAYQNVFESAVANAKASTVDPVQAVPAMNPQEAVNSAEALGKSEAAVMGGKLAANISLKSVAQDEGFVNSAQGCTTDDNMNIETIRVENEEEISNRETEQHREVEVIGMMDKGSATNNSSLNSTEVLKQKELMLTIEAMNEAIKGPTRGLSTVHLGPRWMDKNWDEGSEEEKLEEPLKRAHANSKKGNASNSLISESPSINSQLGALDPEKIYWNEDDEIYIHASGMCFDPVEKVYFTLVNPDEGDFRPLYYQQSKGDLKLAVRGELGQSNKIVLEDKEWDKKAIYKSLSVGYTKST